MLDRIRIWNNVPAGGIIVPNGFRDSVSPNSGSLWALEEVYETDSNTHVRFEWCAQKGYISIPDEGMMYGID